MNKLIDIINEGEDIIHAYDINGVRYLELYHDTEGWHLYNWIDKQQIITNDYIECFIFLVKENNFIVSNFLELRYYFNDGKYHIKNYCNKYINSDIILLNPKDFLNIYNPDCNCFEGLTLMSVT